MVHDCGGVIMMVMVVVVMEWDKVWVGPEEEKSDSGMCMKREL